MHLAGASYTIRTFQAEAFIQVSAQGLKVGHQIVDVRISVLSEQIHVSFGRRVDRVLHLVRRPVSDILPAASRRATVNSSWYASVPVTV